MRMPVLLARCAADWAGAPAFRLSRLFCPECVYPALLLFWGAIVALLLPPMQCPDEDSHAIRSFHLSRGRLHPDGVTDGWLCGRAPQSLHDLIEVMRPRTQPQSKQRCLTPEEYQRFRSIRLDTDGERTASFGFLSSSCFVPYVPQAVGIAVARQLGGSLLTAFYAGRLANLLVCVLALHLALRLLPFYKNLLGVLALLPMAVQQMATLSADALGIASCFLFTALMFRLIVPTERRAGARLLLSLCGCALLLPICKLPYALLTALYLGVRPSRLGSWRRYLLVGSALAGMTLLGGLITLKAAERATHLGEGAPRAEVSCSGQLQHLRRHPKAFVKALERTVSESGWTYCEQLTTLGRLNVPVTFLPARAYLLFLVLMALLDRRRDWCPPVGLLLLALAIGVLGFVAFHLLLYLVCNPVASPIIEGFQGRYIVPFLPVLLLLCYNPVVVIRSSSRALLSLGVAAVSGVQLATAHAILSADYFASEAMRPETSLLLVVLAGGLTFLVALVALERRAERAEARRKQLPRCIPVIAAERFLHKPGAQATGSKHPRASAWGLCVRHLLRSCGDAPRLPRPGEQPGPGLEVRPMPGLPTTLTSWGPAPARLRSPSSLFRPEIVYPVLLLVWGTVLALLLPPIQCPDEGSHAVRSFHLSRGRLHPDGVTDGFHSARVPVSLNKLFDVMCPRVSFQRPLRRLSPEEYQYFSSIRLETDPEAPSWFGMMSYSCFVPYVPQAVGIAVARQLGGSLLTAFYAGRLANLLVCVLALHLALRLLPFYKNLLGILALLPMAVQQMATLSADALGIAGCFLFTALMLRVLVPTGRRPGALLLTGLCGSAILLPLCKIPYALLTLFYLGARPSQLGSWRKYLLVGCALAGMTVLGGYITLKAAEGATRLGEGIPSPDVSRARQGEYLRAHPLAFAGILGRTTVAFGWDYYVQLTTIGSERVPVHNLPSHAYLLLVPFMALVDRRRDWQPGWRLHLTALALGGLGFGLFHLLLYLVWTPVARYVVDGFQGRYFVVFLLPLLLPLYNRAARVQGSPAGLLALAVAAATGVQLATLYALLMAFYFSPPPPGAEHYCALVLVVGGLLFLSTFFAACRRAQRGEVG